eukprot:2541835-Prymnesium_polylepis.1
MRLPAEPPMLPSTHELPVHRTPRQPLDQHRLDCHQVEKPVDLRDENGAYRKPDPPLVHPSVHALLISGRKGVSPLAPPGGHPYVSTTVRLPAEPPMLPSTHELPVHRTPRQPSVQHLLDET